MGTWTFFLDESGRFEDASDEPLESIAVLIGGLLVEGSAEDLSQRWDKDLRRQCKALQLDYPPHATELSPSKHDALREVVFELAQKAGGQWLFLVQPMGEAGDPRPDEALYARMLGEAVDLAARLATALGANNLDVRPAQRTIRTAMVDAGRAAAKGMQITGDAVRAMVPGEVRQVFDALNREESGFFSSWISLKGVEVQSAGASGAHPGLVLADLGCNLVYRSLRDHSAEALAGVGGGSPGAEAWMPVARRAAPRIRQLTRDLRRDPPDLVSAGRQVAQIQGDARGELAGPTRLRAANQGAEILASRLYHHLTTRLVDRLTDDRRADAVARSLAATAQSLLAIKSGSYEGTWLALRAGWCGEGPLAKRVQHGVRDRELGALLDRLVLEASNHRGDDVAGEQAYQAFTARSRGGASLQLLAERQRVRNLNAVRLQNHLPAPADLIASLRGDLERSAQELEVAADQAGSVFELVEGQHDGPAEPEESPREQAIWRAAGQALKWEPADPERGGTYGSAARSWAFLGRLDDAQRLAFRARACFRGDSRNLAFNTTVQARIALEHCRSSGTSSQEQKALLQALWNELEAGSLRRLLDAPGELARDSGARFKLDLALRTLLWGAPFPELEPARWGKALKEEGSDKLFETLSRGELRSHPTELVARHAGELLRQMNQEEEAQPWFRLSVEVAREPGTPTLARIADFSERLGREPGFAGEGPPGSILNPSFEYR